MRNLFVILLILGLLMIFGCKSSDKILNKTGPYLGQPLPGDEPQLFAPGIVCTGLEERDLTMTPDGKEIYFGRKVGGNAFVTLLVTREVNGKWTRPEVVPNMSDPSYFNLEPCISPDGKRFFFISNRPDTTQGESEEDIDIWVMDRTDGGWSEPYNLGAPVNTEHSEFYPTVTRDGTLYFNRRETGARIEYIYRAQLVGGHYAEPEKLPEQVNGGQTRFNAYVHPQEKFIIVPTWGMPDSKGSTDYYISFRNERDEWSDLINLGSQVNTEGGLEYSASLSPDGKFLFFMSSRIVKVDGSLTRDKMNEIFQNPENGNPDIYWMKADFIEELRPQGF